MFRAAHPSASPQYWTLLLLPPLLLTAACLASLAVGEAWLASRLPESLPPNGVVNLCVSMRLSGGWRASVWWEPAVSARTGRLRRPFIQPTMACGLLPWQAWLPSTGELQTSN